MKLGLSTAQRSTARVEPLYSGEMLIGKGRAFFHSPPDSGFLPGVNHCVAVPWLDHAQRYVFTFLGSAPQLLTPRPHTPVLQPATITPAQALQLLPCQAPRAACTHGHVFTSEDRVAGGKASAPRST
jgi:hypothetical protein